MTYQKVTGPLMANSHPGSYCGQDAYSDLLVVDNGQGICVSGNRNLQGIRGGILSQAERSQGCNGFNFEGGCQMSNSVVRRLTPEECERLQGFPKGWTDIGDWTDSKGKLHKGDSDTPRYKALGNSIALPFWFYLLRRISAQYERPATLGSLFDGISGFPLCWERCNGIGTARWSSEIEEFPIAVCKKHFGDEETGEKGDIREWI